MDTFLMGCYELAKEALPYLMMMAAFAIGRQT
jgi:hypothetical protein